MVVLLRRAAELALINHVLGKRLPLEDPVSAGSGDVATYLTVRRQHKTRHSSNFMAAANAISQRALRDMNISTQKHGLERWLKLPQVLQCGRLADHQLGRTRASLNARGHLRWAILFQCINVQPPQRILNATEANPSIGTAVCCRTHTCEPHQSDVYPRYTKEHA